MSEAGIAHVSEPTDWKEICRRFPDQWIVLVAIDWTGDHGEEIRTAFVAGNGTKREATEAARPLFEIFEKLGSYYTGAESIPSLPPILYTTSYPSAEREAVTASAADVFAFA